MISTSINQAIPFLLLPVLTIYLIPRDFGFINNFSAILVIVNSIMSGGLSTNIVKNYFRKDEFFMNKLIYILITSRQVSSDLVGVEEKGRISQALAIGSVINFLLIKMHFT